MADSGRSLQELVLDSAIVLGDQSLLLVGESHQGLLFGNAEVGELGETVLHLLLDSREHGITSVGHATITDTVEG